MTEKKFLIIDSRPYGLFSIFLHTIDNIKWAEDNGYIPVIRWAPGRRDPNRGRKTLLNFLTDEIPQSLGNTPGLKHCQCLYWDKDGWNNSKNPWEYYYEPINNYSIEEAEAGDHKISDIFMCDEKSTSSGRKFLIQNLQTYEPLALWNILGSEEEEAHRNQVCKVIKEKIVIKKQIHDKIMDFHDKYFDNDMLAVHVRGTDKKLEYPHKALPLQAYLDAISVEIDKKDRKIYVASDNNEAISAIFKKFGKKRVVVYSSVRMGSYFSKDPICLTPATGPKHGEECLIEAMLLSKCNHLICTDSNVSAAALSYSPNMTVTYLNRKHGK
jgi:hypothetical protein